jgi:hypothetical protein
VIGLTFAVLGQAVMAACVGVVIRDRHMLPRRLRVPLPVAMTVVWLLVWIVVAEAVWHR